MQPETAQAITASILFTGAPAFRAHSIAPARGRDTHRARKSVCDGFVQHGVFEYASIAEHGWRFLAHGRSHSSVSSCLDPACVPRYASTKWNSCWSVWSACFLRLRAGRFATDDFSRLSNPRD